MRIFVSAGLLCFGCAMALSGFAQSYLIKNLGTPGLLGSASEVWGINRNGAAVGTWWPIGNNQGSQYAFLYTNATNTDLGAIKSAGYDYAVAYAINTSNQVVGQSTAGSGRYIYHAFLYTNGVMADLDNTGQSWSGATAINQSGRIVGFFTLASGAVHAFLLTNGVMQDLGTLGGTYSSANSINDSSVIVGVAYTGAGQTNAFAYNGGVMTNLGTLGGTYSSAQAINNSGQIVGESSTTNGQVHAFLYTGGVMKDLGTFGGNYSTAYAINNAGQIAGYALTPALAPHAFVSDGKTLVDLQNLLTPPAGWTNVFGTYAYALNDAGQIGCSVNWYVSTTNGLSTNYNAVLFTPPVTLSSPSVQTGRFALTAAGPNNQRFVIRASPDLIHWTAVSTNSLVTNLLRWVDPTAASNSSRFYRALMLP
jgi:probable HAF family extracellular repeat protein